MRISFLAAVVSMVVAAALSSGSVKAADMQDSGMHDSGMPGGMMHGSAMPDAAMPGDTRQLVKLPPMMQAHMLGNMRDHLRTLDDVMGLLADGKVGEAGRLAEARLGMSSLSLHGAAQMAPFMPKPMQELGTDMHRLASQFAKVAENADVEHTYDSQRKVFGALSDVLHNCNGCHSAYRIR